MTDIVQFSDWLAICEAKARYCRCLDTKDWAGYADCFTEDLVMDTRPADGERTEGRDLAVEGVRRAIGGSATAHHVHSPEMTIDGDSADVIWAMQDRVVWDRDRAAELGCASLTGYGHYREHYVRCADGRWRIRHLVLTRLHVDVEPLG